MKIKSGSVAFTSQHDAATTESSSEYLHKWSGKQDVTLQRQTENGHTESDLSAAAPDYLVNLSSRKRESTIAETLQQITADSQTAQAEAAAKAAQQQEDDGIPPELKLIAALLEAFTGKKFKFSAAAFTDTEKSLLQKGQPLANILAGNRVQTVNPAPSLAGWGIHYSYTHQTTEKESLAWTAGGQVTTADGRSIDFTLAAAMTRTQTSETRIELKAGDALIDPLVIQFNGAPVQLTDKKYTFDLNADGTSDSISFTGAGGGFLALDKNHDGRINDGRELFGTQSGDGFADLAAYDLDSNGWIDENDSIYNSLRIWSKNKDGSDSLLTLGQAGVGAIYLGKIDTEFSLTAAAGTQQGQLRKSGIILNENGSVGTIQHIDLAI